MKRSLGYSYLIVVIIQNRYLITTPDWIGVLPLDANKYTSQFGLQRPKCEAQQWLFLLDFCHCLKNRYLITIPIGLLSSLLFLIGLVFSPWMPTNALHSSASGGRTVKRSRGYSCWIVVIISNRHLITIPDWIGVLPLDDNNTLHSSASGGRTVKRSCGSSYWIVVIIEDGYLIIIPYWIGVLPLDANNYTLQFGLRRPDCEGQSWL